MGYETSSYIVGMGLAALSLAGMSACQPSERSHRDESPSSTSASSEASPSEASSPSSSPESSERPSAAEGGSDPNVVGASTGQGEVVEMTFNWPESATAEVRATLEKLSFEQSERETTHLFELEVRSTSEGRTVEQRNLFPPSLEMSSRGQFRDRVNTLQFVLPTIEIDAEGHRSGISGAKELSSEIQGAFRSFFEARDISENARAPIMRATSERALRLRGREFWNVLVEYWAGRTFTVGRETTFQVEHLATRALQSGGETMEAVYHVKDDVTCEIGDCVELHLEARSRSEQLRRDLRTLTDDLLQSGESLDDTRMMISYTIVTDPETLRPQLIQERKDYTCEVTSSDGSRTLEKTIAKTYYFQWGSDSEASSE